MEGGETEPGDSADSMGSEIAVVRVQNWASTIVVAALTSIAAFALVGARTGGDAAVAGVAFVLLAVLTVRSCLCSIEIDDVGLVSRNEHSIVRLQWHEVRGFEDRPMRGVGALLQRDGRFVRLQSYPVWRQSYTDALVARLERERRARTPQMAVDERGPWTSVGEDLASATPWERTLTYLGLRGDPPVLTNAMRARKRRGGQGPRGSDNLVG